MAVDANTPQDAKVLQALLAPLQRIANVVPGEPIKAEDWNTVVKALIDLVAAVHGPKPEPTVPPHDHPDQVRIGWLAPDLRALVEGGPLTDPAAAGKLDSIDRALGRLGKRADELDADLKELRELLHDVSTRDLTRQSEVTAVRRVVEGLGDARQDVAGLRKSLSAIEDKVNTAVQLGSLLRVNGSPVDMADLVARLKSLEKVRDRLRVGPDGETLDAAALEERFTKLTNELVTEEELDEALASRPGKIPPEDVEGLKTKLRADLLAEVGTKTDSLGTEIRAETSAALAGIEGRVATGVSDAMPGLRDSLLGTVRPELEAGIADVKAILRGELENAVDSVRNDVGGQVSSLVDGLPGRIQSALDAALPAAIGPLSEALGQLSSRADGSDSAVAQLREQVGGLSASIGPLNEAVAGLKDRADALQGSLGQQNATIGQIQEQLSAIGQIDVESVATQLRAELTAKIDEVAAGIEPVKETLSTLVKRADAVEVKLTEHSEQLSKLDTKIDSRFSELQGALPALVDASVREQVPPIVAAEMNRARTDLAGTVDTRLNEFQRTLPNLVDRQVELTLRPR